MQWSLIHNEEGISSSQTSFTEICSKRRGTEVAKRTEIVTAIVARLLTVYQEELAVRLKFERN